MWESLFQKSAYLQFVGGIDIRKEQAEGNSFNLLILQPRLNINLQGCKSIGGQGDDNLSLSVYPFCHAKAVASLH